MASFNAIINSLDLLTEEQLLMVNDRLCSEIRLKRADRRRDIKKSLAVGDLVTFSGRHKGDRSSRFPVTGTVSKVKRTNADIDVNGKIWIVPIGMLSFVCTPAQGVQVGK